jgi:hypothetical protein
MGCSSRACALLPVACVPDRFHFEYIMLQVNVRRHNARHWIYPTEVPERAYQLAMIKTALLHNTLVCTTHRFDTRDGIRKSRFPMHCRRSPPAALPLSAHLLA